MAPPVGGERESVSKFLKRSGASQLLPLLKREELDDLPLLRSVGATQLKQSLAELGADATLVAKLAKALFPGHERSSEGRSSGEWLLIDSEGVVQAEDDDDDETGEDLQLEENGMEEDEGEGDELCLEENPEEEEGEDELQLEDNADELQLEDNDDDDDLMLEDNDDEADGGGELCLELNEDEDDEDGLQLESNGSPTTSPQRNERTSAADSDGPVLEDDEQMGSSGGEGSPAVGAKKKKKPKKKKAAASS